MDGGSILNAAAQDCGFNTNKSPEEAKKQGARRETASALRGFVVTPDFILQIAPQFRDWVQTGRPKWEELEEAATFVRSDWEFRFTRGGRRASF